MEVEKRICKSNFEFLKDCDFDFMREATKEVWIGLESQLELLIIEGLKRKGFEFENRIDLEQFIINNCRVVDDIGKKQRHYYVSDKPFFLHNYEIAFNPMIKTLDNQVSLSADYGTYCYL